MDPKEYDLPHDFLHWEGDAAEDHSGPFFYRLTDDGIETTFRIQPHHCNSGQTVHGGVLMMFADYSLCVAAIAGTNESCLTLSCNNEFVDKAVAGERILGRCELIRRTGSLAFVRVQLMVEQRIILTSSGVIKRIQLAKATSD
ncbi:PaaI family thioesterase [Aestuariirhabdus sp. Z084]|uniref:PaaI family thioesterase n=1 Tax=Aestuariirhabdus haliotis TaxID=2918751 RepID=UPI00201B4388|nr:PaaI family thioesterase [Aestuariirhabdus haliotis]MCL6416520.1 PaaI family thioesterase [Aestuariirhabdus haliotis]MCL6420510.1 PaaI family thioesterase [Aestuariirhabdus haliotis]